MTKPWERAYQPESTEPSSAPGTELEKSVTATELKPWQRKYAEPTTGAQISSVGRSAITGLTDPFMGAAQLINRAGSWVSQGGPLELTNPVSDYFDNQVRLNEGLQERQNNWVSEGRENAGFDGMDLSRLTTNIVNPVSVAPGLNVANRVMQGGNMARIAGHGAIAGAATAAMQPVTDTDNYFANKAGQIGLGAAGGAVGAPLAQAVSSGIAKLIQRAGRTQLDPHTVTMQALREAGIRADELGDDAITSIQAQVQKALRTGKAVDPAALSRAADFESLGLKGTAGQILRDPDQFAKERNLRGLEGIGKPLQDRFTEQSRVLHSRLDDHAQTTGDLYQAGEQAINRLRHVDDQMGKRVSSLYKQAKADPLAGQDVATTALAQDVANTVQDYGNKLPQGVVSRLRTYGFLDGTQIKKFDITEAESLLKHINSFGNVTDRGEQSAISAMRDAVKRSIVEGAADGGPFAKARGAAAQRFKLHDTIPALRKVSQGQAEPDDFILKHVVRAPASQVKGMANLLDDATHREVKGHIGDFLRRAAYGPDPAGDAPFRANSYAEALRKLGAQRLSAFFDADELAELQRVGRVAGYMVNQPANAAVNNSNTTSALYNLARSTGSGLFKLPVLDALPKAINRFGDLNAVDYSLTGGLRNLRQGLTAPARRGVGLLSGSGATGGGLLANR